MKTKFNKHKNSSNPRFAALLTLEALEGSNLHADNLVDRTLTGKQLAGADRGLYHQLVFGVLRHRGTVDYYLSRLLKQPLQKLEKPLPQILRLGLYQLLYLERVPAHAAVNEAVEMTRAVLPRASGLVNAVLRNFLRSKDNLHLPDKHKNPAAWLSAAFSIPHWLITQWQQQLPASELEELAAASSTEPPLVLRVNTLKTDRAGLMQLFTENGISCTPCNYSPEGVRLAGRHQIRELPGFAEGLFAVQDEASQLVAHLLEVKPGHRLLDACAAPGGKTLHLAQLMNDEGSILATDLTEEKLKLVQESAARLGIKSVQTLVADVGSPDYLAGQQFDRILLDAPCSGLGVIRRNPEAKWRLTPAIIKGHAEKQRLLLAQVSGLLRPGGILVYSTCSIAKEENEQVMEDFLSHNPQFMIKKVSFVPTDSNSILLENKMLRLWPHRHGTDGFFAVSLMRFA